MRNLRPSVLYVVCLLMAGCITPKVVTLVAETGQQFTGRVSYDGPFSGTLTVEEGPNSERFSGRFVVVDRTAVQQGQGTLVVPQNPSEPAVGVSTTASAGSVDASGFWYAVGSRARAWSAA